MLIYKRTTMEILKKTNDFLGGDNMQKEIAYNESNSEVESFELILGYIPGYDQEQLEKKNKFDDIKQFNALYYEIAQKVLKEDKVFVTAVIYKSRVLYPDCPEGGERVYCIKGSRNPYFTKEPEKYKKAVNKVAQIMATELGQTTYSITWSKIVYAYFKQKE